MSAWSVMRTNAASIALKKPMCCPRDRRCYRCDVKWCCQQRWVFRCGGLCCPPVRRMEYSVRCSCQAGGLFWCGVLHDRASRCGYGADRVGLTKHTHSRWCELAHPHLRVRGRLAVLIARTLLRALRFTRTADMSCSGRFILKNF